MTERKKYHWLYRVWIKTRGLLALLVVLAGVLVGLLSLLLPFESLYQKRLENFLSERWGMAVEVSEIDGSWRGYGPFFKLHNLSLQGKQTVNLKSASLSLNVYQMIIPGGRTGIDLSIFDAQLGMIQQPGGPAITINDDSDEARFTDMLDGILNSGSLQVNELTLNLANEDGDVLLAGLKAAFLLEQDATERALKLRFDNLGSVLEIISIGQKSDSLTKDAQWYLKFEHFDLSLLNDLLTSIQLPSGVLDGEIWLGTVSGAIVEVNGQLAWSDQNDTSFLLDLKHRGDSKSWNNVWLIHDLKVDGQTHPDHIIKAQRQGRYSEFTSEFMAAELLVNLFQNIQAQQVNVDEFPQESAPWDLTGDLHDLSARFDHENASWEHRSLGFTDIRFDSANAVFGTIDGVAALVGDAMHLNVDSGQGQLMLPNVFRGDVNWDILLAQVDVDLGQDPIQIDVNSAFCECQDFELMLWGHSTLQQQPTTFLNGRVQNVDVSKLHKYWPHSVWKEGTINWLDRGLVSGGVSDGFVFVGGDLGADAFKSGAAQFRSRAYVKGIKNLYHPNWPQVEGLDAIALFTHDSVAVAVQHAKTLGIEVRNASVDIESFKVGRLDVALNARAKDNQLMDFIQESAVGQNWTFDETIVLGGNQDLVLGFDISIKENAKQDFNPSGQITFSDGVFKTDHFELTSIEGPIRLSGFDLAFEALDGVLLGVPVFLDGTIDTSDQVTVNVDIEGEFAAQALLQVIDADLPIGGSSTWQFHISNEAGDMKMTAMSDLNGVNSALPPPLQKASDTEAPILIDCAIPCDQSEVSINYANAIEATLAVQKSDFQLKQLHFTAGENSRPEGPIGGHIEVFDLDQWMEVLATATAESSPTTAQWPARSLSFTIDDLRFMSRAFTNIQVDIERHDTAFHLTVNGDDVSGVVILHDDTASRGVVGQFERLNWVDALPESELIADRVENEQQDPFPDLHLWVNSFSYLGVPLGEMRLEMRNVADGIQIEQFSVKSPLVEINASGEWFNDQGLPGVSHFNLVMISERMADFLESVGITPPITNAQTLIRLNASWPGLPSQFNVANISGELAIEIGQGQVLDQQPGFGRVLGLFNLTNLPRRLILDFRDVLAEGLHFSKMAGDFVIEDGVANTENFKIKASSASIEIKGDVDFAQQQYDQTILVKPQIGKTFPTLGAIAGGPVGAAAGFLVQGLFDKQLKSKNAIKYQVSGGWDDPKIELIEND